jgi:hypothetical protein
MAVSVWPDRRDGILSAACSTLDQTTGTSSMVGCAADPKDRTLQSSGLFFRPTATQRHCCTALTRSRMRLATTSRPNRAGAKLRSSQLGGSRRVKSV